MTTADAVSAGIGALIIAAVLWKLVRSGRPKPDGSGPNDDGAATGSDAD